MSNTRVVTDREDVTTKEELLDKAQTRANGRAASPELGTPGAVSSVRRVPGRRSESRTVDESGPRNSGAQGRGPVTKVFIAVLNAPMHAGVLVFKAAREAYWVLDRDAKVRSQGLRTVGRVLSTTTREHTDSEGGTSYSYHVSYEYQVNGKGHSAEKQVGGLGALKRGVPLRVFFLPDTYPLASAINTRPQPLGRTDLDRYGTVEKRE